MQPYKQRVIFVSAFERTYGKLLDQTVKITVDCQVIVTEGKHGSTMGGGHQNELRTSV